MTAKEIIAQLERENAELKVRVELLRAQIARLEEHVCVLLSRDD